MEIKSGLLQYQSPSFACILFSLFFIFFSGTFRPRVLLARAVQFENEALAPDGILNMAQNVTSCCENNNPVNSFSTADILAIVGGL